MPTTVFIADDHPIFRQGLVRIIDAIPDFKVVGEAGDGEEALLLIEERKPNVVVVDVSMPIMDGIELINTLSERFFDGEFVVLTMYREEAYFNEAMDLGAKGYLLKECASAELLGCLRAVASGSHYVSPAMSGYLINRMHARDALRRQKPSLDTLTDTERRILRLVAENKTSKEIAGEIHLSYRTVQNHRTNMCAKLGLEGYNKLLQFAIEHKSRI
jgi:DNA-binding NarL/FixJ family response regulator